MAALPGKKRKLDSVAELEIDVSAPEPPSKKALRKAKKKRKDAAEAGAEAEAAEAAAAAAAAAEAEAEDAAEEATTAEAGSKKPSASSSKTASSDYGIWIGNLAFSTTKNDLRRFLTSNCTFSDATITRIHLPKGPAKNGSSQNKGFAYVDFATSKAAKEALALSEQLVLGRRVLIKDAKNFDGRPSVKEPSAAAAAAAETAKAPSKRIFVGNLGFETTKEMLEDHFAQCGSVANVHVATFQDSGKCKGYAWVEFDDLAAASAAVQGFVTASSDGDGEQEAAAAAAAESRRKARAQRIWVNQLHGRRLRMEFAEDATTRYKKRFGKDGDHQSNSHGSSQSDSHGHGDGHSDGHSKTKTKRQSQDHSRYSQETVHRLSGAIVEARGTKTTFEDA